MLNRKGFILSILFAFILLFSVTSSTLGATNETDVWNSKTISDNKKVWTIQFSQPLKESTIKNTTVFVEDENYRLFFTDVSLSNDKKSIIVAPRGTYQENTTYKLTISNDVASVKGKKLEKGIILPFTLNGSAENVTDTPTTGDAISNVTLSAKNFATMVTAISNDTVNKVTANSKEMNYEGNNTYSIGLTGLTPGDTVKIQAYDMNGKRIYLKEYTVN
jgi:hypothetical protein